MKKLLFALILVLIPGSHLKAQEINWESKLEVATAKAAAQETQKFVLLHFTADWCRPCQQLDTFVFRNAMVQAAIRDNVVPLKIDVDAEPGLAKEYGVTSVPHDVVTTADGRILMSRKSPLDSFGYARMISTLKRLEANSNASEHAGVKRQIEELRSSFQPSRFAKRDEGFAPPAPIHTMPGYSVDSKDLQRRNGGVKVVRNPFFNPDNARSNIDGVQANSPSGIRVADAGASGVDKSVAKPSPKRVVNPMFDQSKKVVQNRAERADGADAELPWTEESENDQGSELAFDTKLAAAASGKDNADDSTPDDSGFQPPAINPEETQIAIAKRASGDVNQQAAPTVDGSLELPGIAPESGVSDETSFQPPTAKQIVQTPVEKPALFGLKKNCPVTLSVESRWQKGDDRWGCVHRGVTYLFASQEKLDTFLAAPDKYSPLLAGYDPVIFHETGELNAGDEEFGVFMGKAGQQQIVLFGSAESRDRFKANPRLYLDTVRVATSHADTANLR